MNKEFIEDNLVIRPFRQSDISTIFFLMKRLAVNSQDKTAKSFYSALGLTAIPDDLIYAAYGRTYKNVRD